LATSEQESSVNLHFDSIGLFSDVRLEVGTAHRYDVNGAVSLETNVYCLSEWFHFGCTGWRCPLLNERISLASAAALSGAKADTFAFNNPIC